MFRDNALVAPDYCPHCEEGLTEEENRYTLLTSLPAFGAIVYNGYIVVPAETSPETLLNLEEGYNFPVRCYMCGYELYDAQGNPHFDSFNGGVIHELDTTL